MKVEYKGVPKTFWVVSSPTQSSEMGDILFEATFMSFAYTVRGGLDPKDIVGVYARESDARERADEELSKRTAAEQETGDMDREVMADRLVRKVMAATGDKEEYQKFFQKKLDKYEVKSPAELSDDKKKQFFEEVDSEWEADDEG